MNQSQAFSFTISDTGTMSVRIATDNSGTVTITGFSGGTVTAGVNGSSDVTISGATTGTISGTYRSPVADAGGIGVEAISGLVTDSTSLSTNIEATVFY